MMLAPMSLVSDEPARTVIPGAAPWAADRDAFVGVTARMAASRFSAAFTRWRQLYDSARAQLVEANRRSEMHGLKAPERKEAKVQQAQANEQLALLGLLLLHRDICLSRSTNGNAGGLVVPAATLVDDVVGACSIR